MEEIHKPVLLDEVVATLQPQKGEVYLDLTAGYAGHANAILEVTQNYKEAVLNDRDFSAVEYLQAKYHKEKPQIVHDSFYNTALLLVESGKTFDVILADFGVSSLQLDTKTRGFSFLYDGPLDMRMDRRQKLDAERIINKWSARELAEIFVKYGEERKGRAEMLAREIVFSRPVKSTVELAEIIRRKSPYMRTHPATRVFQAVRIAVNDEISEIEKTLTLLSRLLKPGGRVGIISFHSLEDRLVKNYFKEASEQGIESKLKILTKKPITATKHELDINPRARSAKLRVAERC